jgi:uncharacterized protein
MRRSWLLIAISILLGAQAPDVPSQQQTISAGARAAAERLAREVGAEDIFINTLQQMSGQIVAAINKQSPSADGRKIVDEIVMPEIRKRSNEMTEKIADIWASHFNLEELEQLRAFYDTPVGRKSLHELPLVMAESREAGGQWGRQTMLAIFKEHAEELRALGVGK